MNGTHNKLHNTSLSSSRSHPHSSWAEGSQVFSSHKQAENLDSLHLKTLMAGYVFNLSFAKIKKKKCKSFLKTHKPRCLQPFQDASPQSLLCSSCTVSHPASQRGISGWYLNVSSHIKSSTFYQFLTVLSS